MKYRITVWAIAGFLVAGFWALYAIATFPSNLREVWTLVCMTCPIAIAGMHHAISLYETLAANAFTYALIGLIVETFRNRLHQATN
jgi:hypothetical protein